MADARKRTQHKIWVGLGTHRDPKKLDIYLRTAASTKYMCQHFIEDENFTRTKPVRATLTLSPPQEEGTQAMTADREAMRPQERRRRG